MSRKDHSRKSTVVTPRLRKVSRNDGTSVIEVNQSLRNIHVQGSSISAVNAKWYQGLHFDTRFDGFVGPERDHISMQGSKRCIKSIEIKKNGEMTQELTLVAGALPMPTVNDIHGVSL